MMRPGEIGRRLRVLWQRARVAQDLDEEMRLHLALRREQLQEHSVSPAAANVAARRRFGDLLRLREDAMSRDGSSRPRRLVIS